MKVLRGATIASMLVTTPVMAQPYFPPPLREAPPVTVYAIPPPAPAPVIIGQGLGEVIGGAVALPFQLLNGFFSAFVPQPIVPDGYGGWVPATNTRYDPVSSLFLEPPPLPAYMPPTPAPPYEPASRAARRYPEPGHYSRPEPSYSGCYNGLGQWMGDGIPACQRDTLEVPQ